MRQRYFLFLLLTLVSLTFSSARAADQQCPGAVSVAEFGVDITGKEDVTKALQAAIDSGKSLFFPPATYKISTTLEFFKSNVVYCFQYSTFILDYKDDQQGLQSFFHIRGEHMKFYNFELDGQDNPVATGAVEIFSKSHDVTIDGSRIHRIHGERDGSKRSTKLQYGMLIALGGVTELKISNCIFEDISQEDDDGKVAGPGFSGGLYFRGSGAIDDPSSIVVSNNLFNNIHTTQSSRGRALISDADAIRFYYVADAPNKKPFAIELRDNVFLDVQKRAVKASGKFGGLVVRNSVIVNNRSDYRMLTGMQLFGGVHDSIIENTKIIGNINQGVWLRDTDNIQVNNLRFKRIPRKPNPAYNGYALRMQNTKRMKTSNVTADNARGAISPSDKGK